jgi:stage II sporulation protein P
MIRIRTVNRRRAVLLFILIITLFYLFSHVLLITNKINLYINKQFLLEEIGSSSLVEEDFLKSHISNVLPVINVLKQGKTSSIAEDKDIRWFVEFVTGFDLRKPATIMSSQILLMKKYENQMVRALGPGYESAVWNPSVGEKKSLSASNDADISPEDNDTEEYKNQAGSEEESGREVVERTIVNASGSEFAEGIYIKNEAKKDINIAQLLKEDLKIDLSAKGPQVLLIHTHTSEAYNPTQKNNYTPSDPDRTEDPKYNVVRVGNEIEKNLKSMGISVIHDTTVHDYPSYNGSYKMALESIQKQLKKYPSISVILDIHRDALIYDDGKKLKVTAEVDQEKAAQVMLVVGTDAGGLTHSNWRENLKLALRMQKKFTELYPNLARPINLAPYRYNQHTSFGSLIVEVGANGNTLEEALASSKYIAKTLAEVLKEIKK